MSKYDDIINMSRPVSKRPRMSIEMRASQFAPFSALTGYEDAINEIGRFTESKKVLNESAKERIDEVLNYIKCNKYDGAVKITYFVKDLKKSGGEYITREINIKKIDNFNNKIICIDGEILFDDIFKIDLI